VLTRGQILAQQVALFEEANPDIRLHFVPKKPHGKGGILDYLLTTQAVVPDLLPDLVLIDVDELRTAVQAELLQPLDELIPADLVADLYPFARSSGTVGGRLYALQFQADLDHLVYNTGRMAVPPRSWPGVLSNPGPYIFPAGGQAGLVNDAFLLQYLAVQPQPAQDDPAGLLLDEDSLTAVLQYYQDGVSRGIFPPEILDYHTTDDSWRDYVAGEAALTHVSAHRYLRERGMLEIAAPASIPAINGPATAINRGWALALVATEPARQSAAMAFMLKLMAPETNAAWNQAANYLPTRQSAMAHWDVGDSYTPFINQQLQAARQRPVIANYAQVAAALQEAVEDVVTGAATPEEAAAQVMEKTK
jgi:multiple sugar transport system substrate-binding protein